MLAVLAATFELLVPGHFLAQLLRAQGPRERTPLVQAVFEAAALSVLVVALCAHALAAVGVFSDARLFTLLVGLTAAFAAGCVLAKRPLFSISLSPRSNHRGALASCALHDVAPFALVAVLASIYYPPTQFLFGSADEGVYSNAALQIAHTGKLVYRDVVIDSLPDRLLRVNEGEHCRGFHYLGSPKLGGPITPHGFHLLPSWLAALHAAGGLPLLFAGPIALTCIALLALYSMAARFGGPLAGLLAAGLLGTNCASVWFARVTNAEGMTEMLLLSGFALLALGVPADARLAAEPGTAEQPAHRGRLFAAGLLLGAVHLAKIEFFLLPWSVLLATAILLASGCRARDAAALPLGYALTLALAVLEGFGTHRLYLRVQLFNPETFGLLNAILFLGSFVGAGACALVLFARRNALPGLARRLPLRNIVIALGAVTLLLAVYLYWGLPLQSSWGTTAPEKLAGWQRALAVPPEIAAATQQRTWRELTFRFLGLYISTLGVFCGVVGVFVLLLRKECAALAPFLCMVLVQTAFFLLVSARLDYGSANPHTPGRRFLSLTIPGFVLAGALPWFVLARSAPRWTALALRTLGVVVCACIGGLTARSASRVAQSHVWTDTTETVRSIAARGDERIVWIAGSDDGLAIRWIEPLYFLERQKVFVLSHDARPHQVDAFLGVLRKKGWMPVLLRGNTAPFDPGGGLAHMTKVLGAEGQSQIPVTEFTVIYQRHRIPTWSDFFRWKTRLLSYGRLPNP